MVLIEINVSAPWSAFTLPSGETQMKSILVPVGGIDTRSHRNAHRGKPRPAKRGYALRALEFPCRSTADRIVPELVEIGAAGAVG